MYGGTEWDAVVSNPSDSSRARKRDRIGKEGERRRGGGKGERKREGATRRVVSGRGLKERERGTINRWPLTSRSTMAGIPSGGGRKEATGVGIGLTDRYAVRCQNRAGDRQVMERSGAPIDAESRSMAPVRSVINTLPRLFREF